MLRLKPTERVLKVCAWERWCLMKRCIFWELVLSDSYCIHKRLESIHYNYVLEVSH